MQLPAEFKDIHLPEAIGWWPPAPGWLALAVILILTLTSAIMLYLKKTRLQKQKQLPITLALNELAAIQRQYYDDLNKQQLAANLSKLLRRVALYCRNKKEVASLHGQAWLAFLDYNHQNSQHLNFTQGVGHVLAKAPYQTSPDYDAEAVIKLCREWLLNFSVEQD